MCEKQNDTFKQAYEPQITWPEELEANVWDIFTWLDWNVLAFTDPGEVLYKGLKAITDLKDDILNRSNITSSCWFVLVPESS